MLKKLSKKKYRKPIVEIINHSNKAARKRAASAESSSFLKVIFKCFGIFMVCVLISIKIPSAMINSENYWARTLPWALAILVSLVFFFKVYRLKPKVLLIFALPLMLATAVSTAGIAINTVNSVLDSSQVEVHRAEVLDTVFYAGRSRSPGFSRYAIIRSWRTGNIQQVSVPTSLYQKLEPGKSLLEFETKAGALGYEWIVTVRLLD